jgi:hypothetical protein
VTFDTRDLYGKVTASCPIVLAAKEQAKTEND